MQETSARKVNQPSFSLQSTNSVKLLVERALQVTTALLEQSHLFPAQSEPIQIQQVLLKQPIVLTV